METTEYRAEVFADGEWYAAVAADSLAGVKAKAMRYVIPLLRMGAAARVEYWKCQLLTAEGESA